MQSADAAMVKGGERERGMMQQNPIFPSEMELSQRRRGGDLALTAAEQTNKYSWQRKQRKRNRQCIEEEITGAV